MTEGVRGYEFKEYFSKIPIVNHHYLKVCSLDEIPNTLKVRQFIIVNLSKTVEPGNHWIIIFRSGKHIFEIFNSLGFTSLEVLLPYFKPRLRVHVIFNEHQFQSSLTSTCGYFCIYFAIHRVLCYDQCFSHVLEECFDSSNTETNENKCIKFCSRLKMASDDSVLFEDSD